MATCSRRCSVDQGREARRTGFAHLFEHLKEFFRTWYVPSNASLVIVGDFQPAEARKLVEKYFRWTPKRPEPAHARPAHGKLTKSDKVVLTDAVQLQQVVLAYHSPARVRNFKALRPDN